jgi:hypothetical protein
MREVGSSNNCSCVSRGLQTKRQALVVLKHYPHWSNIRSLKTTLREWEPRRVIQEYREFVDECLGLTKTARSDQERQMVETWAAAAELSERREGRPAGSTAHDTADDRDAAEDLMRKASTTDRSPLASSSAAQYARGRARTEKSAA